MARKILLADDSVTAQNMGRKILADAGYEVIAVNNGSAALKKVSEQKPDLIVLDVYMPGYSGLEVCQRLKETNETARIPILLTVGKLEPFKPEEAKRVRADGFIVKPFEASELLSALTKLEDKIVPHTEGSKPGRFARAIAAVEEGRYDKTVAADEDSGWKSRINFPSRKKAKQKPEPEDADDAAIYNPVNKDLRTVVERPSHRAQPKAEPEESKVDLGALAPEGLPKDVTPEEIAALAAAAARVTGAAPETKTDEIKTDEIKTDAPKGSETKVSEAAPEPVLSAPAEPKAAEVASTADGAEKKTEHPAAAKAETQFETRIETKIETHGEAQTEVKTEAQPEPRIEKFEAKSEAATRALLSAEPPASTFVPALPAQGESAPAAAAKEAPIESMPAAASALDSAFRSRETSDEPVTMAVAAGAESAWARSRWTAVAVTLAPEEAELSLENEMQKASAAFAAAEALETKPIALPQTAPPASEPALVAQAAASTSPAETASAEPEKIEPARTESASIESAKIESAKIEPENFEPAKIEPEKIEPEKIEPAKLESAIAPVPAPAEPKLPAPVAEPSPVSAIQAAIAEVASIATDAVNAVAKRFEKVSAAQIDTPPAPFEPPPVSTVPNVVEETGAQTSVPTETKAEETPIASATDIEPPKQERTPEPATQEKSAAEFPVSAEAKYESKDEPSYEAERYQPEQGRAESEKVQEKAEEPIHAAAAAEDLGTATPSAKLEEVRDEVAAREASPEAVAPAPTAASPVPESTVADSVAAAAAAAQAYIARLRAGEAGTPVIQPTDNPIAGGTDDMAKKESDIAATAAGAWASWRRIRDVGDKPATPPSDGSKGQLSPKEAAFEREESATAGNQDKAAMAVAAGAEKAPEEVPPAAESDSGEIANIVDSVLADLRPKIVEEISKKLGKRK